MRTSGPVPGHSFMCLEFAVRVIEWGERAILNNASRGRRSSRLSLGPSCRKEDTWVDAPHPWNWGPELSTHQVPHPLRDPPGIAAGGLSRSRPLLGRRRRRRGGRGAGGGGKRDYLSPPCA